MKRLPGARDCRRCDHLIYPHSYGFAWSWTHVARGLCSPCYAALTPDERLDYPRLVMSRDDFVEDWELLRSEGYTKRQAAERLGMTYTAFDRAYWRAKKVGAVA